MNLAEVVASRFWTAAGLTMIHYLWVGAILGMIAALVRAAVVNHEANRRYLTAQCSLFVQAIAPILIFVWVLPADPSSHGEVLRVANSPSSPTHSSANSDAANALLETGTISENALLHWHQQTLASCQAMLLRLSRYLPWVWAVGTTAMLFFLTTGIVGSRWICRETRSLAGSTIQKQCAVISRSLGITKQVAVAVSSRVVAPVVIGIWKPTILLPVSVWAGFTPAQIEMILWHELAHVRRLDNLMNVVERCVQSVLFFQPAIWIACRWVRFERENCCDRVALRHATSPKAYAATLASLAAPGLKLNFAAANGANHQLVARIRCILQTDQRSISWASMIWPRLLGLGFALVCVAGLWSQQNAVNASFSLSKTVSSSKSSLSGAPVLPAVVGPNLIDMAENDSLTKLPVSGVVPLSLGAPSVIAVSEAVRAKEIAAAKEISKLGGWLISGERGSVEEVNLAYRDIPEGRLHNEISAHSDEGLRLVSAFPRLKRLALYRGQASDEALSAVADLKELEVITSWNTEKVTDKGIQHLAGLNNLREAYFDAGKLGDASLHVFGTLPKLEILRMLIGNEVTDSGLAHLANASKLRELAIGQGKHVITDAGVDHLMKLSALENLNLADSNISPAGVARLQSLPHLQVLRINANELYQRRDGQWIRVTEA